MKKVKVKRHSQQIFTYLGDRFCSHCGSKGVYEDGADEDERLYCFACEGSRPYTIYDPDQTLPKLKAREAEVVDAKEWEAEVSPFEKLLEDYSRAWANKMAEDILSGKTGKLLGLTNMVGGSEPIKIEVISGLDYKKGWYGD